jgi:SAM-dependent methyltransferase
VSGTKEHWERVYDKSDAEHSWTQAEPRLSLELIGEVCGSGRIIDVGGGSSRLAELLLDHGYEVAVLDISERALERARGRLGRRAGYVQWIAADVTSNPDPGVCDVWHDRAVFHFLTDAADRAAYVSLLTRTLRPGGHAIIATFSPEGPPKCSGLDVRRYDGPALAAEIGPEFELLKSVPEVHTTPWGNTQAFQYSVFRRPA